MSASYVYRLIEERTEEDGTDSLLFACVARSTFSETTLIKSPSELVVTTTMTWVRFRPS